MSPPPDEFTPFRIGFIPDILTRLTWCRIQQISLAFVILQGSHLEIFDWKGIANILTQPQFDDLQHILIIIHIDRDDDDGRRKAEAVIKEGALSIFDSGRILDIEFRDEITGTYY
jgi:hypothetical protein